MFSVFSNTKKKPSCYLRELQKCAGASYNRMLIAGPIEEPLYMLKPEVQNWLYWINNKILYELPKIKSEKNTQWIGVRIRIATNMLNKLEQNKILNKDICLLYHQRLTSRVREIFGNIHAEDLPFLG